MDRFILHIDKVKFHIEPLDGNEEKTKEQPLGEFKIYKDDNVFLLNEEKIDDIPPDHLVGTLTLHDHENPKDFDFNGSGKISGEELVQLAELIIQHLDDE